MRVDLEAAFVLHTRNFTDSRVLVELLCSDHGRISAVARSGRKGGRFGLLRPFQPVLVSWQGKSDLKSLVHTESAGPGISLKSNSLYCGIYLNELLVRVLAVADPQPVLFLAYQKALEQLAWDEDMETVLRGFELDLLTELGYGVPLDVDAGSGESIDANSDYVYTAANGFTVLPPGVPAPGPGNADHRFRGEAILAIGRRNFTEAGVRSAAKRLCRLALEPLLGGKPLKSRELFAEVKARR